MLNEIARKKAIIRDIILYITENSCTPKQACKIFNVPVSFFYYHVTKDSELQQLMSEHLLAQGLTIFSEVLEEVNKDYDNDDPVKIGRDKLNFDKRKYYLSKLLPKVFGERVDVLFDTKQVDKPEIVININGNPDALKID